MKPYYARYHEEVQTDAGDAGGGAAAAAGTEGGDKGGEQKPPQTEAQQTAELKAAIDEGLGYTEKKEGEDATVAAATDPAAVKAAVEAKAATEAAAAAKTARTAELKAMSETDRAAAVAADAKKEADALAAKAAEAAKPKPIEALALTDAEKKMWKGKTAERYNEVFSRLKTESAEHEKLKATHATVVQARDSLLGVLEESQTSPEQLSNLLAFSTALNSGTRQGLEEALLMIEGNRVAILKKLGREAPGYDPLDESANKDLAEDLEEGRITRERALEIASARKDKADAAARAQAGSTARARSERAEQDQQAAVDGALNAIEEWAKATAATDIDFKEKEAKINAQMGSIVKDYRPQQWLATIKLMYSNLKVEKAAAAAGGAQPLRPSGGKTGSATASTMLEAINQGLGYVKTG